MGNGRVRDLGTLSPKCDVFIKPLPSGCREHCGRGGKKIVWSSGDGGHQGNNRTNTHKNSQIVAVWTGPAQDQMRWGTSTERVSGYDPPNPVGNVHEGKISFLHGVSLKIQTTLKGSSVPSRRWPTQNKHKGNFGDVLSHNGHCFCCCCWDFCFFVLF